MLNGGDFAPTRQLAWSGNGFGVTGGVCVCAAGTQWVGGQRCSCKHLHPLMHRTSPHPPQNYVAPNVSSARVERPDNTLDSSSPLKPVFGSFSDNVMDVRAVVFISNI